MRLPPRPLCPDVGVLSLVYHDWSPQWQTPHHVLTRLARYFNVVWVNPPHDWRHIGFHTRLSSTRESVASPSGFTVYVPEWWLPRFYRPPSLATFTSVQRLKRARRLLVSQGCSKLILYLWHPQFAPALLSLPFDLTCYHIDDEYSFSTVERRVDEAEATLIAAVDQVFIHSPALLEKKGAINPRTTFAPQGVDYNAHATPVPQPADIAPIPRPRIGYSGVIKNQLDWPLLVHLASRHPEWSFVFVGAHARHPEMMASVRDLSARSNVYFLGAKSTDELAAYPQHFDVCIMPYQLDDYTKYINPLKLHEYLASGRPIVATPIRSLEEFPHVLSLARTYDDWSSEIANALSPLANAAERRAERQAVARQHDWQLIVGELAKTMGRGLSQAVSARIQQELDTVRTQLTCARESYDDQDVVSPAAARRPI